MPSPITTRNPVVSLAIAASLAVCLLTASSASGAPAPGGAPLVTMAHAGVQSTASTGLDVSVSVTLRRPASRLGIRLRVLSADGSILIQENQTRGRLDAATYVLGFTRQLRAKELREGRDRLEVQVTVPGQPSVSVTEPLYVADPSRAPIRLAVVVRATEAPATDPDGKRSAETTEAASLRAEAGALMRASAAAPEYRLTFALPPFLLDQWGLAGTGIPTGLPLLRIPYADPDVSGLEAIGALGDLGSQLERTSLATSDTPASRVSTGAVVAGDSVSMRVARTLSSHGIAYALVSPDAVSATASGRETTATPGVHAVMDTTLTALVIDSRVTSLLTAASTDPLGDIVGLLDHLFSRLTAKTTKGQPSVAVITLGAGSPATATGLEAALAALSRVPWVRLTGAAEAAAMTRTDTVSLPSRSRTGPPAPAGYWDAVSKARSGMLALRAATGAGDTDVLASANDVMFAESRSWAGGDGGWALADRGLAFAASATKRASSVLSAVSLAVPAVTLSGNSGKVPVSVTNRSEKELRLSLHVRSASVLLPGGPRIDVVVRPGENILSVPVDLREALKGSLLLDLYAGASPIASTTCVVRASYIDRLGMLGGVVLVLLILLWFVRTRGSAAARLRGDPEPGTDRP